MALTNIEYGSLASSAILNSNFLYLDNKIAEVSNTINTSISSILSNIATINSRLADLSEEIQSSIEECNENFVKSLSKQGDDLKLLINGFSMLPNWGECVQITDLASYTAPSNGYLLIYPQTTATGNIVVNNNTLAFKAKGGSQMAVIPLKEGDVLTCGMAITSSYFLPAVVTIAEEEA